MGTTYSQQDDKDVRITLAKHAGFCFGVRDAVEIAREAAERYGSVYMLGHIVHNERVVQQLAASGVKVVDSLDEIKDGPVLFRAHGTPDYVWSEAKQRGLEIIDATCPLVHEIHDEVKKMEQAGRQIYVIGDKGHDEVLGIMSQVENPILISTPEEAESLRKKKRGGVVAQSTQMVENVQKIIGILMMKVKDLQFVNTVCHPTRQNQVELKDLATSHDLMIVIGSFTSANTKRLTALAKALNPNSYQVEDAHDIQAEWLSNVQSVGIHAGASTPDITITEVQERIESLTSGRIPEAI